MKAKTASKFARLSERNENGFTGEFVPISAVLTTLLGRHETTVEKLKVQIAWEKVFDDYIKKHSKNLFFSSGHLAVHVELPSLRNEMFLSKTYIIRQLNLAIGENLILEMAFY
jgi:hypothetical protein